MEENAYSVSDELRRCELEILLFFRDFCAKNGLRYFITAGTLLGAVRHKGFIPWDDDIDVVMPKEDFAKFAELMKNGAGGEYFYQDGSTDKHYPFDFAKLRSGRFHVHEEALGDINDGCYIDIFPLDDCPQNENDARKFFKLHLFFTIALMKKFNPKYEVGYEKKAVKAALAILRRCPAKMLRAMRMSVKRKVSGGRLCTVGGAHGYPCESYDAEWFGGSVEMEFEGERFSAPSGWKNLLENMYGDYMTPPAEDERRGHFTKIEKE